MTLALSRHLRSSGNKCLLLALLSLNVSCSFIQGALGRSDDVPEPAKHDPAPVVEDDDAVEPTVDPEKGEVNTTTVVFHNQEYQVAPHKKEFKIALILPFYYEAVSDIDRRTSEIMIKYYQGVKLALKELERSGLKLKLYVYDNKNDTNELKKLLDQRVMQTMDMLIGPIRKEHMKIVSDFSRERNIPAFSPFTSITDSDPPNPVFYSASPGMKLKAQIFVDYLEKNHADAKLIILRDGKNYDREFVPYLLEALEKSGKIFYMREAYSRHNRWEVLLREDSSNVVYIPSYHRSIVSSSIGGIYSVKRDVTVFGESAWADFEDNDYNFWSKMNVHLLANEFVDNSDTSIMLLRQSFRDEYNSDPSIYGFMGYDQMSFIGEFLMAFGEYFPMYISERDFKYLSARYHFTYQNGCQENRTLFILKYEDYKLVPVQY